MLKHLILPFLIAFVTPAVAQDYEEEVKQASQLGLLLYEFDRSAWVATDALRENEKAWKLYTETATPKGWATTETGKNRLRTAFVAELDGKLVSVFDAETKGKKVKKKTLNPLGRSLTDMELIQIRAKAALPLDEIEPCAEFLPMNSVVIPSDDGDGHFLYIMSATTKPNLAIVGRHFRFRISADGRTLSDKTGFTNTCLGLSTVTPKGASPAALMTTHMRTPYPQENHVFLSLANKIPMYVATTENEILWKVDGTSIKAVEKGKLAPK